MAWGARQGLKDSLDTIGDRDLDSLNGLWSPFGIGVREGIKERKTRRFFRKSGVSSSFNVVLNAEVVYASCYLSSTLPCRASLKANSVFPYVSIY